MKVDISRLQPGTFFVLEGNAYKVVVQTRRSNGDVLFHCADEQGARHCFTQSMLESKDGLIARDAGAVEFTPEFLEVMLNASLTATVEHWEAMYSKSSPRQVGVAMFVIMKESDGQTSVRFITNVEHAPLQEAIRKWMSGFLYRQPPTGDVH